MSLMQGTTVLKTIMGLSERGICINICICAGSLYTGNELEIEVFNPCISHLSLQCLYESGLVYNDTFVLNVD